MVSMKLLGDSLMRHFKFVAFLLVFVVAAVGCNQTTGKLSPAAEQKFAAEGIVRRADDLDFRYTHDAGRRDTR